MASYLLQQTSKERYDIVIGRYNQFIKNLDNTNVVPIKVFDPLGQKQMDDLDMIRETSRYLQKKIEDDANKEKAEKEAEAQKVSEAPELEKEE